MAPQIVTFISDFGSDDHYASVIKGALLCQSPALNLVDISHNVKKFDIVQAAFILGHSYHHFPKGSIHLVNVMARQQQGRELLAIAWDGHYFLGPDNGIFPLAFDGEPMQARRIGHSEGDVLGFRHAMARAVGHIISDAPFGELGDATKGIERRISLQPVISHGLLNGSVIHIDGYGNVILNIDRGLFQEVCADRPFQLFFKRNEPLSHICRHYSEVPVGDVLCLFNSSGHLEIAMNMDNAAEKYGLKVDDTVIVKLDGR